MTNPVTRRALFGITAGSLATLALSRSPVLAAHQAAGLSFDARHQAAAWDQVQLPMLNYATGALEPTIDQRTMEIHHGKHHQAYIDNLAKLVAANPGLQALDPWAVLNDIALVPEELRTGVRNNLGGHVNHAFFWTLMTPNSLDPSPELVTAIERDFGSIEDMQTAVNDAGLKRFGSGWTWLVVQNGALAVVSTPNQDNPMMDGGGIPILGIDVWEHAYYLTYQNHRADYLKAWWDVVDWYTVSRAFEMATKPT